MNVAVITLDEPDSNCMNRKRTDLISTVIAILALAAVIGAGCNKAASTTTTYLGDTNSIPTLVTPDNFTVTPAEANDIRVLQNAENIAVHHIYHDADSYYICDGFFGSKETTALRKGLRINGRTGEIYNRTTGSWDPKPK